MDYLKFGFIESPSIANLLCEKVFSNEAMKPSRLKEHLTTMHSDKASKSVSYIQSLSSAFSKRKAAKISNDLGLQASYNLSHLIAKNGKPHNTGKKLILSAILEMLTIVMKVDPEPIIKAIPQNNDTVSPESMAGDTEQQLCDILKHIDISVQLDGTSNDKALLMAYIRFARDEKFHEEFLFACHSLCCSPVNQFAQVLEPQHHVISECLKVMTVDMKLAISDFCTALEMWKLM